MPFLLLFAALGAVASVVGAGIQAKAAGDASAASKRAEDLRAKQAHLEAESQRRQTIRSAIAARAQAEVAAQSHGAQGSSAEAGGRGQIANQSAENLSGIKQGERIGQGIFSANKQIADAGSLAAWGQGMTSLGTTISGLKVG